MVDGGCGDGVVSVETAGGKACGVGLRKGLMTPNIELVGGATVDVVAMGAVVGIDGADVAICAVVGGEDNTGVAAVVVACELLA